MVPAGVSGNTMLICLVVVLVHARVKILLNCTHKFCVHKPQQNPVIKELKKQGKGKTTFLFNSHFIHMSLKITVTFIKNNTYSQLSLTDFSNLRISTFINHQSLWIVLVTKLTYWLLSIMNCIHFLPDFVNGDSILGEMGFPLVFMGTLLTLCQSWYLFLLKTPLLCLCSLLKPVTLNHSWTWKLPGEPWQNNDVGAWIHLRSIKLEFLE